MRTTPSFVDALAGKRTTTPTGGPGTGRPPTDQEAPGGPPHPAHDGTPIVARPVIVRLADVYAEPVVWQWRGRLAHGKLALIVGNAGMGKSWITLDIAAHVSTGRPWPDDPLASPPPSDVLLLSAEDGLADTIRPRLDALGADVTRVHHLAVLRAGESERAIQLKDTAALEQAIAMTHAKLLIIDPVSVYLGSTDSHRDAEVRGLLAPLSLLAQRTDVAILGVMHLAKGGQRPAIHRAVGSIAFAAAARIVLAVAHQPERPDRRLLVPVKSNLSAPPAVLAYTLADGRLTWEQGPVLDVDVDALLDTPSPRDREEQTDAEQVIVDLLDDVEAWPLEAKAALAAGTANGVHERTLRRTARQMGIRIERLGFGARGKWVWHRPERTADSKEDTAPKKTTCPLWPLSKILR